MSDNEKEFGQNNAKVAKYVADLFRVEDPVLEEIRTRSKQSGLPQIQVGKWDARLLEVLTRSFNAKRAVEIGTLGGYSGVSILRGLIDGGKLYSFELRDVQAEVARESFRKAGFADRAEVIVGPALQNLSNIKSQGPFDLVFIDADKPNYVKYFEWAAENLRVGGVILADNTFAWGLIADEQIDDEDLNSVLGLRAFNKAVAENDYFRGTILPTAEGLTMAVKIK